MGERLTVIVTGLIGFSEMTTLDAEGARVGIRICDQCSAAILIDPRDDYDRCKKHAEWHGEIGQPSG